MGTKTGGRHKIQTNIIVKGYEISVIKIRWKLGVVV